MKYTYDVYEIEHSMPRRRTFSTTDFSEIEHQLCHGRSVKVWDNSKVNHDDALPVFIIETMSDLEDWRLGLERSAAWKPESKEIPRSTLMSGYGASKKQVDAMKEKERMAKELEDYRNTPDPTNPSHYQVYMSDWNGNTYQWIEGQQMMNKYTFEGFNNALEIMARKYIDREGGKDPSPQELGKCIWYLKLWQARIIKCGNVRIRDIDRIITEGK